MKKPNPYPKMLKMLQDLQGDFDKFYDKNNKTAGTRLRKAMKDLRDYAQKTRVDVQVIKNEETAAAKKSGGSKPAAKKPAAKPAAKPAPKKK